MVKKISCFVLFIAVLLASLPAAYAASLTASTDKRAVAVGQGLALVLSLQGASPEGAPDLSALEGDFKIHGTARTAQTSVINGQLSSMIGWRITLIPLKEGTLEIPAFSINTDQGVLKSEPVTIEVAKGNAPPASTQGKGAAARDTNPVSATATLSKPQAYRNEPVMLSARLIATRSMGDVRIPELNIPDAIVEQQGEAQITDEMVDGRPAKAVSLRYLVTPLKDGRLKIPALVFDGRIESDQPQRLFSGTMTGRFADPFGMLEDMGGFAGLTGYEPFAVETDALVLEVKPPPASMNPWLPAQALTIKDDLEGARGARVGEPLTRTIRMSATGLHGAVLPGLEDRMDPQLHFKIYADKPEFGADVSPDGKTINGWRQESYTLIPQSAGVLILPEIRLPWWDVVQNKMAYAVLPARQISVEPGAQPSQSAAAQPPAPMTSPQGRDAPDAAQASAPAAPVPSLLPEPAGVPFWIYALLAGLSALVLLMGAALVQMWSRVKRDSQPSPRRAAPDAGVSRANVDISALKAAQTPEQIRQFLQDYAHAHWGLAAQSSLRDMAVFVASRAPDADVAVFAALEAALYANGPVEVAQWKERLLPVLKRAYTAAPPPRSQSALNPS